MDERVAIKRVYDLQESDKAYRVLVDRIWPRGVSKEALQLDEWCRELAPSSELRKWFGHDPKRWGEFKGRYRQELSEHTDTLAKLRQMARDKGLLLLYSARDSEHNQAVVLKEVLLEDNAGI